MSKFFINRPIVAMVIAILMVIVGAVTIATLPIAQFPNIAPPEIRLQANYPGADAKTLEDSVATPIEQQVNGVDNMTYMYSLNATANQQTAWDSAIYFSASSYSTSSYSTLGCNDVSLPATWRTLGPLESVIGVLMCCISASLLFAIVTRLINREERSSPKEQGAAVTRPSFVQRNASCRITTK